MGGGGSHHISGISSDTFLQIMSICKSLLGYQFHIFGTQVNMGQLLLWSILIFNVTFFLIYVFDNR